MSTTAIPRTDLIRVCGHESRDTLAVRVGTEFWTLSNGALWRPRCDGPPGGLDGPRCDLPPGGLDGNALEVPEACRPAWRGAKTAILAALTSFLAAGVAASLWPSHAPAIAAGAGQLLVIAALLGFVAGHTLGAAQPRRS